MLEAAVDDTDMWLDRIDLIVSNLRTSKLGGALIEFGLIRGVDIQFYENMPSAGFFTDSPLLPAAIDLKDDLTDQEATIALAHELAHVEQSLVAPYPFALSRKTDAIKLMRIFEAVASTVSVATAYELFLATQDYGYLDAFDRWEEQDIREAFLKETDPTIPVSSNPIPFMAGFNAWYRKQSRVDYYDECTSMNYDTYQDCFLHALFPDKHTPLLTFDQISKVGLLFEGHNFLTRINNKNPLLDTPLYCTNIQEEAPYTKSVVSVSP